MSVNYSAYLFVGAEVPDTHFYAVGKVAMMCSSHGRQDKQFCGDCGRKCYEEIEKVWKPTMTKHATKISKTPEEVWSNLGGDEGDAHYLSRSGSMGPFGFYRFGYENDVCLFGIAITRMGDDDRFDVNSHSIVAAQMADVIAKVQEQFKVFNVEQTIRVLAVQDCG